jgi:GWxTD domain-containing protein
MLKKAIKYFLFTLSALFFSSFALLSNTLDVYWSVKRYYQPERQKHYIELYYLIPGNLVNYTTQPDKSIMASVITSVEVYNSKGLISKEKYILNSPNYLNDKEGFINLTDLLRIEVPEDSLQLIFKILDKNDSLIHYTSALDVVIEPKKDAFLSDIMPVNEISDGDENNSFFRNGKVITPRFLSFYPNEATRLSFYVEFYQPEKTEGYLYRYLITDDNGVLVSKYANFKKINSKNFDALLAGFDITDLASGNYYLYVELRDSENKLIERKRYFFQRSNQRESTQSLSYHELDVITNNFAKKYDLANILHHVKALKPIADEFERAAIDGIVREGNLEKLQNYFFTFWKKRDATNAEAQWMAYAEKLQYVEQRFTTTTERGFETERGRVYLKYGPPVERIERPNSSVGQYEVWYYEHLRNQSTVYFVFVNQNRITEEFFLVHTNLVGEIYSRYWAERIKNGEF